jgi:hypothetical protein
MTTFESTRLPLSKTITLRLSEETYRMFSDYAVADNRPISNLIETAAIKYLRESSLASPEEMAGIRADRKLVSKLRAGSESARKRQGRFAD